jgi:hypothetical protein
MPAVQQGPYSEVEQSYGKETEIVLTIGFWFSYRRPIAAKTVSCGLEKRVKAIQGFA